MSAIEKYNAIRDTEANAKQGIKDHRVMMFISGKCVESSCIFSGTLYNCQMTTERLNKRTTKPCTVSYKVLPCID